MADQQPSRRVDILGLIFGVIFLGVAVGSFGGSPLWLFSEAGKWIVTGIIGLIGIGFLISALPRRKQEQQASGR
ncbi:hypothetical protein GIS00_10170 [Nakamurella sp. YIM 132087]|uniref:Uncharacterized protein n=1 Tax=Nakamurella alba TaxID=2665158 RepID=A0A7K1FM48_9ACTN|nr:hypothetical protein [Nakamurella alba]MTD14313.1 hypothetical protein [Nakamurella alba]